MLDKGKYSSHGVFIKRIQQSSLANRQKAKLATIHPIPTTQPRQKRPAIAKDETIKLQSSTFKAKHKFQDINPIKPVPPSLTQPFFYIEKILKKRTVDQINKELDKTKQQPFTVTKIVKKSAFPAGIQKNIPKGYNNLYEYEQDKRKTANKIFQKMLQCQISDLQQLFRIWSSGSNKTKQLNITQKEFLDFMQELMPNKISTKNLKHFYDLYRNVPSKGIKEPQKLKQFENISIKAMTFNFNKFKKAQLDVANVLSQKALKQRYIFLQQYNAQFNENYPELKNAMQQIKNYQEKLRIYFKRVYNSYENPYQHQIQQLQAELDKPIIKYDKIKKQELTKKIEELANQNQKLFNQTTDDYNSFLASFQRAILPNHDLFFTKRTANKLLLKIIQENPLITREILQSYIGQEQNKKQRYLECLSDLVVELDFDKRQLGEQVFTLAQFIDMIIMWQKNNKKHKHADRQEPQEYVLYCSKKLIKQIKRQFLLKNQLFVEDIQDFPADQEIPIQILHKCFQMECTKVLLKNQIWTDLINLVPAQTQKSNYHQKAVDGNVCMEFLKKYFDRLDKKITLQLRKSKQISALAQQAHLENFGKLSNIIEQVTSKMDQYVQDADQESEKIATPAKKKVGFADVVQEEMQKVNNPVKWQQQHQEKQRNNIVMSIIKAIHDPNILENSKIQQNEYQNTNQQQNIPENLSMLKTLAKSSFVADPKYLNTNSFDIRFYQKMQEKKKQQSVIPELNEQLLRTGQSILLANAPKIQEIQSNQNDPLRISRFLLNTLDEGYNQSQKVVKKKIFQQDIKEGINQNYYRQKLKLQNKPARWDSQGKTRYSMLLPVAYYEGMLTEIPDQEKWYLRPHHLETLTQNPLSKKDNIIRTDYESKFQKIPLKKRPQEFIIEENVKRKEGLIQSLEDRLSSLKKELNQAKKKKTQGVKVPTAQLDKYLLKITEGKQDKELQQGAYEAILYDLRSRQRNLLNQYRQKKNQQIGQPAEKWWERKDSGFHDELRKDRQLVSDSLKPQKKHKKYVQKLKNDELY